MRTRIAGEKDVRVQVAAAGNGVGAELLWCPPEEGRRARLDAVRVDGEQRQVWHSHHPAAEWKPEQAARFVHDLRVCDEDALAGLYRRLG